MGNIDRKQIMATFIRMIDHISNKKYQERAWIKGEEADFDEAVCLFFEYADPILETYKDFKLTEAQYQIAKKFRDEFEVFTDEHNWPEEFIDTPEWGRIMALAKEVLKAFNYSEN